MASQYSQNATPSRDGSVVPLRRRPNLAAIAAELADEPARASYSKRLYLRHRRLIRRAGLGVGVLVLLAVVGCLILWWRLASGPIQLDVVTPWLAAAIEENFGSDRHVEVGGTQIERTENGGTAVRIRDIVVRDADGTVVASAPKAEVRVSGMSLLSGHMRAESLSLVGAEMAVRIERDGALTIFAGANTRPIATAAVPVTASALRSRQRRLEGIARTAAAGATPGAAALAAVQSSDAQPAPRQARDVLAALLSWIGDISSTGLDGHELREFGLKNGNLSVDDERTGKRWTFKDISLSVQRSSNGGIELNVGSDNSERPWTLSAVITPTVKGFHKVELEAHRVMVSDLLLASRLGDGSLKADLPVSASISGEIGPDGEPQSLTGRIVADDGEIGDAKDKDSRVSIDRAEFKFSWDAASRMLTVPFQILSGGTRMTLLGQIEAPEDPTGVWSFRIGGGTVVLAASGPAGEALILNRIAVTGSYDAGRHRFVLDQADVGNAALGLAMSGSVDFADDMRVRLGLAGTPMSAAELKQLWPVFVASKVRDWFNEHLVSGTVEHIVIAVKAPFETLKDSGPPVPDDGLTIDILGSGCVVRPIEGLPALRDADLSVHIVGRDAMVALGKATADLPSGRKLTMTAGTFEVPDTAPHQPPAKIRFKLDGPVPAAIELLRMDRLSEVSEIPFDPATTRGTMTSQVALTMPLRPDLPPGATNYTIAVEAKDFTAEHLIMGQRVDAAVLRASANPQGFQLKGDVKIGGMPATLDYRKMHDEPDAEVHISALLDENARKNLDILSGGSVGGAIPIRLGGHVAAGSDREGRFQVEADLTPAQIEGLLPGWTKPAGKPARATFTLTTKPQSTRIDDLLIEGAGGGVKGTIELDDSGEVQSASFPAYGFSDGDRASLKVDRSADGALRVIMRGDVYDARGFVKAAAGETPGAPTKRSPDVDLDIKLGAVVGFNGEALRGVDLKMSRRAGEIRSLGLSAKIGRDATLTGDLRSQGGGRQVINIGTNDAGAFFRFADIYSRMTGGQMSLAMDPPAADDQAQQGEVVVHNFVVHDETQLERAVSTGSGPRGDAITFSAMRVSFSRMPGRVGLRDGVVRGPLLGGTIDGLVDYTHDEIHLRGTLVPLYGPNNLLGQLPLLGIFLGGEKEGLLGITYEVVGRPGKPVLRINPISALAPGILRKVFEFPVSSEGESDVSSTPGPMNPR
jgi:hypothetical protein